MTSRGLERTWIRTGGYGRFRGEWVKSSNVKECNLFTRSFCFNKILRNRLLSEHLQWNFASFNVKINRLTSISSNEIIKLLKYFTCGHSSHAILLIETILYLSLVRSRNFASLPAIFGSRQVRAKILSISWLLATSQTREFHSVTFNV